MSKPAEHDNHKNVIFHVDMDAFFASVEQRDNPQYRGKPVIVGAQPGQRGVVCAASYEARKFGVHSAMPVSQAYARCPKGIFVQPRMSVYSTESRRLMAIFATFSPLVEQISVDEAFLDMSGTEKLWRSYRAAAEAIGQRIRDELRLTGSIGIAPNKFLAKLASDCNKPNGITEAPFEPQAIIDWLSPMAVSRLWGVGEKMTEVLAQWGIRTVGQLQQLSQDELERRFGLNGLFFYELCRGLDDRPVGGHETSKSISREHTFGHDCSDPAAWRSVLLTLSHEVARQARGEDLSGRTVFLTWRTPDFKRHTRRVTLEAPTNVGKQIYETALQILEQLAATVRTFRLIGVGITNFSDVEQTSLFEQTRSKAAWEASEKSVDSIIEKFGKGVIFHAAEGQSERRKRRRPAGH
jgi:nucleotidyltransferase/DNA polymerase involved in DNA repair